MKVPIKVQKIVGTLSTMSSRMSITFKCFFFVVFFFVEDHLWFFLKKGKIIFVIFIHIIQKISFSMSFLRKIIFHFPSKKKYHIFWRKSTTFPDNTRKIIFQRDFFRKDQLFAVFEENIIFPCIFFFVCFFEKDHL